MTPALCVNHFILVCLICLIHRCEAKKGKNAHVSADTHQPNKQPLRFKGDLRNWELFRRDTDVWRPMQSGCPLESDAVTVSATFGDTSIAPSLFLVPFVAGSGSTLLCALLMGQGVACAGEPNVELSDLIDAQGGGQASNGEVLSDGKRCVAVGGWWLVGCKFVTVVCICINFINLSPGSLPFHPLLDGAKFLKHPFLQGASKKIHDGDLEPTPLLGARVKLSRQQQMPFALIRNLLNNITSSENLSKKII